MKVIEFEFRFEKYFNPVNYRVSVVTKWYTLEDLLKQDTNFNLKRSIMNIREILEQRLNANN